MVKNSTSARSPLSPTLWPASAFLWWRSLVLFAALVIVVLAVSFAVLGVAVALYGREAVLHMSPPVVLAGQAIIYVPAVLVLLIMLPWLSERTMRPQATSPGESAARLE